MCNSIKKSWSRALSLFAIAALFTTAPASGVTTISWTAAQVKAAINLGDFSAAGCATPLNTQGCGFYEIYAWPDVIAASLSAPVPPITSGSSQWIADVGNYFAPPSYVTSLPAVHWLDDSTKLDIAFLTDGAPVTTAGFYGGQTAVLPISNPSLFSVNIATNPPGTTTWTFLAYAVNLADPGKTTYSTFNLTSHGVPEPATYLGVGLGLAALAFARRRFTV